VFRVTRKTGKKPKPGPFLGFFRITQNRNRIQNSFRITRIRKKTETLFSGLPKSGKKPEYFFSDYPNPKKNRNTFFRITRIRKKTGILFFGLPESEKKTEYFFSDYPNPEKNRNTFFRITRIRKKTGILFFGLPESGKNPKPLDPD
jgi:hypothetical protein